MTHRPYVLAVATAVAIGVAALLVDTGATSTTATTTAPLRDANVPAPELALPYIPRCSVQPFDIGQFDSLAPGAANPSVPPVGSFHVLEICDNGTITISFLSCTDGDVVNDVLGPSEGDTGLVSACLDGNIRGPN